MEISQIINMKNKKTILVTGGLGYIGSHTVVELIEAGFDVIIVDNLSNSRIEILVQIEKITGTKQKYYNIDVCNEAELDVVFGENKIDSIIHFAAYKSVNESMQKVVEYYQNNIGSLLSVLGKMEEYGVENLIFSSSCTVYGQPDVLPVTELAPIKDAESVYGTTKIMGEKIIQDFIKSNPTKKAVLLRYFNPVGAHESGLIGEIPAGVPNNLFPYITQTISGKRDELKIFGSDYNTSDGTAVRDYIHVVDLANAHVKGIEYVQNSHRNINVFNIGNGYGYSVLEVVKMFEKYLDKSLNYAFVERREGDIEKIYSVCDKANKDLDWKSERGLDSMVSSALKWESEINKLF